MFTAFRLSYRACSPFVLGALVCGLTPLPLFAADRPIVRYDVPYSIAVRDVTSICQRPGGMAERIIAVNVRISTRIDGAADAVRETRLEIVSAASQMRVYDFSPKEILEDSAAEPVTITRTDEEGRTLGATIGAGLPIPAGPVVVQASPSASAQTSRKAITTETIKRHAGRVSLLSAGTMQQEHGVFFKLRPSSRQPLEGTRDFLVLFAVPTDWQGDWLRVSLSTRVRVRTMWQEKEELVSEPPFLIGIYLAEAESARRAAEDLAAAQSRFFAAVARAKPKSPLAVMSKQVAGSLEKAITLGLIEPQEEPQWPPEVVAQEQALIRARDAMAGWAGAARR